MKKIFFPILLLFVACQSNVFDKVEIDAGEYKLYFIPIYETEQFYDKPIIINKQFYIEDKGAIKEIVNNWKFPTTKKNLYPQYSIQLTKNNKLYYSLFLNADLDGLLTPNGNYQFDTTQLFNYEKYFKNLQIKEVTVLRLNDARNFIQIVLNSSYYLPARNESMKYYWEEFNGKILLSRKNDDNIIDDIDVFIEEEFRTIDSIKVMTYYYDNDSYIIELCSKKNLNNLLPIGYSIVQEWKELDSLTLEVANASDEIINKLSQENRIDLVSIKNYNALHK